MAHELVKYHNDLNAVAFRKFTPVEMNLFFAIVSKMRDKGTEELIFTLNELKDLSNYKERNFKRFAKDLDNTYSKILGLNYGTRIVTERSMTITRFVLFTEYSIIFQYDENMEVDLPNSVLKVQVNPKLYHILNELEQWTNYSLEDFVQLKSSYSKTAYRLLKQFRTTGRLFIRMEDFREQFDVPKSYKVGQIDQKILEPIKKELKPHFKNLKIKKIKSSKLGNPVVAYEITFQPEALKEFKQIDKSTKKNKNYEKTPEWVGKESKNNELSEVEKEEVDKLKKEVESFWK